MAYRRDAAGDAFVLALLEDPIERNRIAGMYAAIHSESDLAVKAARKVESLGDRELLHTLADRVDPDEATEAWLVTCESADSTAAATALLQWHHAGPMSDFLDEATLSRLTRSYLRVVHSDDLEVELRSRLLGLQSRRHRHGGVVTFVAPGSELLGFLLELPIPPNEFPRLAKYKRVHDRRTMSHGGPVEAMLMRLAEPGMADACVAAIADPGLRDEVFDNNNYYEGSEDPTELQAWHRMMTRTIELEGLESDRTWSILKNWLAAGKAGANDVARSCMEPNLGDPRFARVSRLFLYQPDAGSEADLVRWVQDEQVALETRTDLVERMKVTPWVRQSEPIRDALANLIQTSPHPDLRDEGLANLRDVMQRREWFDMLAGLQPFPDHTDAGDVRRFASNLGSITFKNTEGPHEIRELFGRMADPALAQFGDRLLSEASDGIKDNTAWREPFCDFAAPLIQRTDLAWGKESVAHRANTEVAELWYGNYKDEWITIGFESGHRTFIKTALQHMGITQVLERRDVVESFLSHESDGVRLQAIQTLSQLQDMRTGTALVELLQDPSEIVRERALETLQEIRTYVEERERWAQLGDGAKAHLSPLGALLQQSEDEAPAIRLQAIRALGALGDPAALPHLIEFLRHDDEAVREAAQHSIDQLVDKE